jgi:hypothetical protein
MPACSEKGAAQRVAHPHTEITTSLLWEISGNGLTHPSYLYGTMHIIPQKDFQIRPYIDSIFVKTEQVVFELKLDDMAGLMKLPALMALPEGTTLQGLMQEKEYMLLKNYLQDKLGADIETLQNQKPFAIMQMMTEAMIDEAQESFELYFFRQCMQYSKPIFGLETVDEQMAIFDAIPYDEQIEWIMEEVEKPGMFDSVLQRMITAYKEENLEKLAQAMYESSPEMKKYESSFLTERNKKWIAAIETFMQSKTTFIAVGAGHLPGNDGLLSLLREKGYTVKPV